MDSVNLKRFNGRSFDVPISSIDCVKRGDFCYDRNGNGCCTAYVYLKPEFDSYGRMKSQRPIHVNGRWTDIHEKIVRTCRADGKSYGYCPGMTRGDW